MSSTNSQTGQDARNDADFNGSYFAETGAARAGSLDSLPFELHLLIVENLAYHDLKCLERVSKSMRALVATRTTQLDAVLFKSKVSLSSILRTQAQTESSRTSLELHPLLRQLRFTHGQRLEEAQVCNTSGFGKSLQLLGIKALDENATSPPLRSITFQSFDSHGSFDTRHAEVLGRRLGCSKIHRVTGKQGVLTVRELLHGFIASLEDFCDACAAGLEHSRFEGWDTVHLAADRSEAAFEGPTWGEREWPQEQGSIEQECCEAPQEDAARSESLRLSGSNRGTVGVLNTCVSTLTLQALSGNIQALCNGLRSMLH